MFRSLCYSCSEYIWQTSEWLLQHHRHQQQQQQQRQQNEREQKRYCERKVLECKFNFRFHCFLFGMIFDIFDIDTTEQKKKKALLDKNASEQVNFL